MNMIPPFKENKDLTFGVELELQLVNLYNYDLTLEANDFLRRLYHTPWSELVKPEITQSMIEINSTVHSSYESLKKELTQIRDTLVHEARKAHLGICGGGTHPFQKWKEQKIFQSERFVSLAEQYGYLAKQFTVFGQHIHVSCLNGDDALYLCHALAYYIPHFIALAASSPFNQDVDTAFDCSRLAVVSAFPLSGTPPWIFEWTEFADYYFRLSELGIVRSMKDFYWDIRPKPEYGTVEIRVCDTPLTVERAADLAYYAYNLVDWLLSHRPEISRDTYLTYLINRFRATRFGLNAQIIDPTTNSEKLLSEDILETCYKIENAPMRINCEKKLKPIKEIALTGINDSSWLRDKFKTYGSTADIVRSQVEKWEHGEDYNL